MFFIVSFETIIITNKKKQIQGSLLQARTESASCSILVHVLIFCPYLCFYTGSKNNNVYIVLWGYGNVFSSS